MTVRLLTPRTKKPNIYSDFHKDLRISPVSKDLALLKDEDAVKESIKNLILTDPGERLMQPYLGGGVRAMLFENITPATLKLMESKIRTTIELHEPRADLIDVNVYSVFDDNAVQVIVRFYIRNLEAPIELDVILERIR